jgi:hypothetical protein
LSISRIATLKRKALLASKNTKQKVEITDYEIEKILKGVLERQDVESKMEKYRTKTLSKIEVLNSTRDERKLNRYDDMMVVWRKDSERTAKQLNRSAKDSLISYCDVYRRK